MADTFRALCAELRKTAIELADLMQGVIDGDYKPDSFTLQPINRALDRAEAALAEGAGVGASDEELLELSQYHGVSYTMVDGGVIYPMQPGCDMRDDVLSFARAVLARYGAHPRPIPLPERPFIAPFTGFYDNRGQCWCGTAACVDQTGDTDVHIPPSWELREPCPEDDCLLPAAAIPLPEGEK
jgi:hypothetical protein